MDERTERVRREITTLVVLVLLVDGIFIGGYFMVGLVHASTAAKISYTVVWTLMTMVIVLRGYSRIRAIRGQ